MKMLRKMLPYLKKVIIALSIIVVLCFFSAINIMFNGDKYMENFIEKTLEESKTLNKEIPYFMLAEEYRKAISFKEYVEADTDEEVFELFEKINEIETNYNYDNLFIINSHQSRKGLGDVLTYNGERYIITHYIEYGMNKFGIGMGVVKWKIYFE